LRHARNRATPVRFREGPASKQRDPNGDPITMPALIAVVLVALLALTVVGFALHLLFSPWLLVAVAIVAWIKFRPHRSHR
jgi:Flp pilus assembly protein TadB